MMFDTLQEEDLALILVLVLLAIFALEGVVFYCVGYRRGVKHSREVEQVIHQPEHK
jgi:hypothetical protein